MNFVSDKQDVGNETYDVCDSSVLKKKIVVTYGQSVHLGCFVKIPDVLKNQHVTWYHHSKEKGRYEFEKELFLFPEFGLKKKNIF